MSRPSVHPGHRQLTVLRGAPDATARDARALLAASSPEQVLWVSGASAPAPLSSTAPRAVRGLLGTSWHAVVLDLHEGLDAEVLGQCEGLLLGGGRMILRTPEGGLEHAPGAHRLAVHPHTRADVGTRFARRLERLLSAAPQTRAPVQPPSFEARASAEQDQRVRQLLDLLTAPSTCHVALLAERGRGKSAALGRCLRALDAQKRVVVTAGTKTALDEVFRFARGEQEAGEVRGVAYREPLSLLRTPASCDVLVVDEAAQLPVPVLRGLVERHPGASLVFSTTTAGYEGTGRGFSLRFLSWLEAQPTPLHRLTLHAPIRYAPGDPLERFVYEALLLSAQPATLSPPVRTRRAPRAQAPILAKALDRDALASDERTLAELFGLLVHAHYRTTPHDLHALLDAPNMRVHVLRLGPGGPVVAANLLALEGNLDASTSRDLLQGRRRLQGHALPESLLSHLGRAEAGALSMVRSVRLVVHPEQRRQHLASRLVAHTHAHYQPDLFGTLFGLTPELLRFRRTLGYQLARLGASRGARTGEPAAMMLRAASPRAHDLLQSVRRELARDLPEQLDLLERDGELWLDETFRELLLEDLPPPVPHDAQSLAAALQGYLHGPRIYESVAPALRRFVQAHEPHLAQLDPGARTLIHARVLDGRSWPKSAEQAGLASVPAAMRALRRALRALHAIAGASS